MSDASAAAGRAAAIPPDPGLAPAVNDPPVAWRRWMVSALVVTLAHAGVLAAMLDWRLRDDAPGSARPTVAIDLAPLSAAPEPARQDIAPGPEAQQAEAAAEPAEQTPEPAALPPAPPQPDSLTAAPTPPQPRPATEARRKPERPQVTAREPQPPAPRSTAPPRVDRVASVQHAAAGAEAAAALASYGAQLRAHVLRYKRYPDGARAAQTGGTAVLSFTVGRGGQLVAARLGRSSGSAALDAETLAAIRRAQPLPPFPAGVPQSSLSFNLPFSYTVQ
jgi:protein TonB